MIVIMELLFDRKVHVVQKLKKCPMLQESLLTVQYICLYLHAVDEKQLFFKMLLFSFHVIATRCE